MAVLGLRWQSWVVEAKGPQSLKYLSVPLHKQFVDPCSRLRNKMTFRMLLEIESSCLILNDHPRRTFFKIEWLVKNSKVNWEISWFFLESARKVAVSVNLNTTLIPPVWVSLFPQLARSPEWRRTPAPPSSYRKVQVLDVNTKPRSPRTSCNFS